jgi:hypothetical protein
MADGMKRSYGAVHPQTRYSFWLAFGIEPSQQLAAEEYFRNLDFQLEERDKICTYNDQVI